MGVIFDPIIKCAAIVSVLVDILPNASMTM